jgi:NitT/TauT family transport system substrate-binding protein
VGVGAGDTFIAAMQHGQIVCGMTSQPTVVAIENKNIGYSAFDLSSGAGVKKWLGGNLPTAGVLALKSYVDKNPQTVQKVVDALVATMHWISTHTAAQIAAKMPAQFVSNGLTTKADYISALAKDKGQFLPDGIMPKSGPATVFNVEKLAGKITGPVNLKTTYTNAYALKANKLEGFKVTTK